MNSASVEVRLNRAVPTPGASAPVKATAAAVARAHMDFVGVTAQCCPCMLWPVVRNLQQLQQQQEQQVQQQLLKHGIHDAPPTPAAVDGQPDRGLVPQHGIASSSTASSGDVFSAPGFESAQAAQQAGVPGVAAATAVGQAAAPAAAPTAAAESAVSIQWELCLQTSSSSHVELLAESGQWLRLRYMQRLPCRMAYKLQRNKAGMHRTACLP